MNAVGVSKNPRVEIRVVDRHVLPGAPRRVSGSSSQGPRVNQAGAHLVGLAQALLVAQLVVEDVGGGGAGEEGEEEVLALLVVLQPDAGVVLPAVAVDVGRRAQAADAELVEGLQRVDGEPLPTRLALSVGSLERISGRRWAPIIRLFCSGSLGWMRRRHGYLATAIHVIAAGRLTFLLVGCAQKNPSRKSRGLLD